MKRGERSRHRSEAMRAEVDEIRTERGTFRLRSEDWLESLLRWVPQVLGHAGGLARPFEIYECVNPDRAEGDETQAHDNQNEIHLSRPHTSGPLQVWFMP